MSNMLADVSDPWFLMYGVPTSGVAPCTSTNFPDSNPTTLQTCGLLWFHL